MSELGSSKGHRDENFPVASWLIKPRFRAPIMTFYRFARAADDIADHPTASDTEKLARLADMRAGLSGKGAPEAEALAKAALPLAIDPAHAQELLDAFVQDVTVKRYWRWEDLIAYCRLSAMPVGRFVLDVHGESPSLWPQSDALCAALQVINHLQDCQKDFRALGRVYLPEELLWASGLTVEVLAQEPADSRLLGVIRHLTLKTQKLLRESAGFAYAIRDPRLSAEVAVIQALAEDLAHLLLYRTAMDQPAHHSRSRAAGLSLMAVLRNMLARARG